MNTGEQSLFLVPVMESFHPGVSCTANKPADFWFLGFILFPDKKSVQLQFIALHFTKEIHVYFVCLKSTNSIKGMADEILTQELVHTFNHTCGRIPLEDWLCCPLRMMSKSITFNRHKTWPSLQCLSRLVAGTKIPASAAGSWLVLCTQKCLSRRAHSYKDPLLQRAAGWIWVPSRA